MIVVNVQLEAATDVGAINKLLESMAWLELAGVTPHVTSLDERDKTVAFLSNWLCLGRTRPALER